MKPININETNATKISGILESVQKRSKVRTITAEDIYRTVKEVEKHLGIPKKYLNGVCIHCDLNAQDFPNAYKYRPESTHFTAEYRSGTWKLTDVWRDTTERTKRVRISLTEEAEAKVIECISVIR